MKKRILFVDDDPMVLQGLQRMLRPMRDVWDMEFANGGAPALEIMARQPFDVVVSDMRMPGMNGAELLNEVMARHPRTVRLILSGQSDLELITRCIGTTHQYLAKPCDAASLKAVIARAASLDAMIQNERVRAIVSRMNHLPSLPALYLELNRLLADPDVAMERVGDVMARDIAMTGQLLKIVNSAFFGLSHQASTPMEAASHLGMELIKSLVLAVNVFSQFDFHPIGNFSPEALWHHSIKIGRAARVMAGLEDAGDAIASQAFNGGLLHDAGKLVLMTNFPRDYSEVINLLPACGDLEAERSVFGTTHTEIGGYLFGLWGLPAPVVEAIVLHHQPERSADTRFSALTAVHTACALLPDNTTGRPLALNESYLRAAGLLERVPAWTDELQRSNATPSNLAA